MKKNIRNLFLASCFLFAISYDSCTLGIGYDKKYKLYPEVDDYSCTMTKTYGHRWERLGFVTFGLGTSFIFAVVIAYRRKQENTDGIILNLVDK